MRSPLAALASLAVIATAPSALGACPERGVADDPACEPHAAMFVPGASGLLYRPRDGGGSHLGAGLSLALFAWANDAPSFGPGVGRIGLDVGLLKASGEEAPLLLRWALGPVLSFERAPGRAFAIPYYAVSLGGLRQRDTGHVFAFEGGGGLFLLQTRRVSLDAGAAYVLPLRHVDALSGYRVALTLSVNLW